MNIGIDIGGSHIAIGVVNEKNEMILKEEHNQPPIYTWIHGIKRRT